MFTFYPYKPSVFPLGVRPPGSLFFNLQGLFAHDLFWCFPQISAFVFLSQMQSVTPLEPGKALANPTLGTWAGEGWHQGRGHPLESSVSKIQIPI